jgi:hypothetical protein
VNEQDFEELQAAALMVRCPRCGRQAGVPCYSYWEHKRVPAHPSRLAMAAAEGAL